ncbi:MAG: hypothetical protein COA95_07225 [Methylophaga sp.]|nr:MAG: hypothetical protein COA95_07225 [Methylophaga sp.]
MLPLHKSAITPIVGKSEKLMTEISRQHRPEAFQQRMQKLGASPQLTRIDPAGTVKLALSEFSPFEGEYASAPYLMLHMCTRHIGRIRRFGDGQELEGVLRPGTVGLALPNTTGEGYWEKMQMLGIAVDLEAFNRENEQSFHVDDFAASASALHNDPLITAVMTAMWRDAEVNGLSSAFFDHGLNLVLNRLSEYNKKPESKKASRPLTGVRLTRVLDLIEERISTNVTLLELAQVAEQDKSSFSRSFRQRMGYAPYEYFTFRRMERAKQLLHLGQSVTEVAFTVGYLNPSKFSAAFRRVLGFTPSEWKLSLPLN